jgi:branched-subunit amino acid aminotransferase/4-amino-4-deoxychorismate lyase
MVSAEDRGLLFGEGAFETLRAYQGTPFRLEDHLNRLERSVEYAGFEVRGGRDAVKTAIAQVLQANGLQEAHLRVTVTPGPEGGTPTLLAIADPLPEMPVSWYAEGVPVAVSALLRDRSGSLAGYKTTNYLVSRLARRQARAAGAEEAVLLNAAGRVAEGSGSNVFLVRGGVLATPPLEEGILAGVTRAVVLALAPQLRIEVQVRHIARKELDLAGEVFLTSTLREILPVKSIDGRPVGTVGPAGPGIVTRKLLKAYRKIAGNPEPVPESSES